MATSCSPNAHTPLSYPVSSPKETTMKEWLKPEITESEAGMEVTSYLPAELDRA